MKIIRRLGATERAIWLRDRISPMHFSLTAQIIGEIAPESLQFALARLQERHPLLRVRVALDSAKHPCFVEDYAPIPLRIISRESSHQWEREIEAELAMPFSLNTAPLMRVVWVRSSTISELIITCDHAIADGVSTVNLIQDLLQSLANPDVAIEQLSIPPAQEDLLPGWDCRRESFYQKLRTQSILWLIRAFYSIKQLISQSNPARLSHCHRLHSGALSPEFLTVLKRQCREEKTTVHAAICAAFLLAIAHQKGELQPQALKCLSPINIRPYLTDAVADECGLYMLPGITMHSVALEMNLWELARSLKSQLMAQMTADCLREKAVQCDRLISVNPSPEVVQQAFVKQQDYDLMVTNLGQLNLSQQFGHLRLQAIYGPGVMGGIESETVVGVASLGEQLFFTLLYPESTLSFPETEMLSHRAIQLLVRAIAFEGDNSGVNQILPASTVGKMSKGSYTSQL
jgi:Condensation domain